MRNFGTKLLAFFLAIIFWIAVLATTQNLRDVPEPIAVSVFNQPKNLAILSPIAPVSLRIDAPLAVVENLAPSDFSAFIDLDGKSAGIYTLPIQVSSKNQSVRIVRVTPAETTITIEPIETREIGVFTRSSGLPDPHFRADAPKSSIEKVKLSGPKTVLSSIVRVEAVAPLSGNESTDTTVPAPAVALNAAGKPVDGVIISPEIIDVMVPIFEIDRAKTVGVRANFSGAVAAENGFISNIETIPSIVTISGDTQKLRTVSTVSTDTIDLSKITKSTSIRVRFLLPEGLFSHETEGTVNISIDPYHEKTETGASIKTPER